MGFNIHPPWSPYQASQLLQGQYHSLDCLQGLVKEANLQNLQWMEYHDSQPLHFDPMVSLPGISEASTIKQTRWSAKQTLENVAFSKTHLQNPFQKGRDFGPAASTQPRRGWGKDLHKMIGKTIETKVMPKWWLYTTTLEKTRPFSENYNARQLPNHQQLPQVNQRGLRFNLCFQGKGSLKSSTPWQTSGNIGICIMYGFKSFEG